jgi:hypothetical protein
MSGCFRCVTPAKCGVYGCCPGTWPAEQPNKDLVLRAADMLTAYAELIRRDGATHVEEHHYLPEVDFVTSELRKIALSKEAL